MRPNKVVVATAIAAPHFGRSAKRLLVQHWLKMYTVPVQEWISSGATDPERIIVGLNEPKSGALNHDAAINFALDAGELAKLLKQIAIGKCEMIGSGKGFKLSTTADQLSNLIAGLDDSVKNVVGLIMFNSAD